MPNTAGKKLLIAACLLAYFLAAAWDGLTARFAQDEMMAIWMYWHPSPWRLLTSQFLLYRGYFRPLAGLYYVPIYLAFGLNPLPYKIALLALLAIGAWMMYRFARVLGVGETAAALVALMACYHAGLSNLYYNSVFVFDVLCGIFYCAAFAYYAGIRASGRLLTGRQTAAFLGLYLCALNSKEMAVTLPVVLLAYEWFCVKQAFRPVAAWLRGPGRPVIWAGLMNLVYIYGKRFGAYGLMKTAAYTPVFSWERLVDFQERYLGDIFLQMPRVSGPAVVAIWLVVTYLAWRRDRPVLRFCWVCVLVTPLPIEFIIGRDQACLYVTLAGWAVFFAVIFLDLVNVAPKLLAGEPLFRRLSPAAISAVVLAAGVLLWAEENLRYSKTEVKPSIAQLAPQIWDTIQQFQTERPRVAPRSEVVFLEDPFHSFDTAFIAELWFRDRSVKVKLNQETPLSPEELAKADRVFTFKEGKLIQVR